MVRRSSLDEASIRQFHKAPISKQPTSIKPGDATTKIVNHATQIDLRYSQERQMREELISQTSSACSSKIHTYITCMEFYRRCAAAKGLQSLDQTVQARLNWWSFSAPPSSRVSILIWRYNTSVHPHSAKRSYTVQNLPSKKTAQMSRRPMSFKQCPCFRSFCSNLSASS